MTDWGTAQRDLWANRAKDYDKIQWTTDSGLLREFLSHCPLTRESIVLDVGTGTGIVAQALAGYVRMVRCSDVSPDMLRKCQRNSDLQDLYFAVEDVQDLTGSNDAYGLATARMVFHHVEDVGLGLREIHRVLAPSGSLVLMEGVPPDHRCRERYEKIFELKEKRHTFSEAELVNHFERAGFVDIALYPYWLRRASLQEWLRHSGLPAITVNQIRDLHVTADPYFKQAYNFVETAVDILMDWKFVTVVGRKA